MGAIEEENDGESDEAIGSNEEEEKVDKSKTTKFDDLLAQYEKQYKITPQKNLLDINRPRVSAPVNAAFASQ